MSILYGPSGAMVNYHNSGKDGQTGWGVSIDPEWLSRSTYQVSQKEN